MTPFHAPFSAGLTLSPFSFLILISKSKLALVVYSVSPPFLSRFYCIHDLLCGKGLPVSRVRIPNFHICALDNTPLFILCLSTAFAVHGCISTLYIPALAERYRSQILLVWDIGRLLGDKNYDARTKRTQVTVVARNQYYHSEGAGCRSILIILGRHARTRPSI